MDPQPELEQRQGQVGAVQLDHTPDGVGAKEGARGHPGSIQQSQLEHGFERLPADGREEVSEQLVSGVGVGEPGARLVLQPPAGDEARKAGQRRIVELGFAPAVVAHVADAGLV